MTLKTCTNCNKIKSIDKFELRTDTKKVRNHCKDCKKLYLQSYKQSIDNGSRTKNKIIIINNEKKCIDCLKWKKLEYFPRRSTIHGYRHECKECKQNMLNVYYNNVYNEVRRNRKKNDVQYKLLCNHRNYVHKCLTVFKQKEQYSLKYLGCDLNTFKKWLEYQFDNQMSWNNYGSYWTLDHILPLSHFDFTISKHQNIAFNWKNTRPSTDNFVKGNNIRCYEFFSNIILVHRFIQLNIFDLDEYQGLYESKNWLREKLKYGKNLIDDDIVFKIISEMDNPHPSS